MNVPDPNIIHSPIPCRVASTPVVSWHETETYKPKYEPPVIFFSFYGIISRQR